MKLYYVPRTRATRPRWMLEELGVPYELVRLDPSKGETRTPEHLARQPLGHVPALEDGDVTLFESAAICLWLAERFPEKGLVPPPGTAGRAAAYQWLFFAETELEPPLGEISRQNRRPEAERDAAAIADARKRFLAAAAALEAPLARNAYLLGGAFTVADLVAGACTSWGKALAGGLDGLPSVEAWLGRLKARPAWKRATAD
ncbi:glutathione S-transferase family protein [Anaeromyxobacter oryzae]|uniref:Glutathione S-transferase n=1 Tax=Anaeromyxobacter oryzae TaxID=2918170 RepID=A0ABN6MYI9_9BACT|nr:glutathione S-transferase family protein [Anaeromyxobacter oryzae]BDG04874.1 glutathione S-transferase [Anaeromyxobacter oryzae]